MFVLLLVIWAGLYRGCLSGCEKQRGECINLYKCPALLDVIKIQSPESIQLLIASTCGIEPMGDPLVCCEPAVFPTTTKAPPSTTEEQLTTERLTTTTEIPTTVVSTTIVSATTILPTVVPVNRNLLPSRDVCGEGTPVNKIVGGKEAGLGEFPWMSPLLFSKDGTILEDFKCGGALISERYVITAAHCVTGPAVKRMGGVSHVRLGEHDTTTLIDCREDEGCNDPPVDVEVEEIIAHAEFNINTVDRLHDIALLRLKTVVVFTDFIRPLCLPYEEQAKEDDILQVAGWGRTVSDPYGVPASTKLLKINLKLVESSKCREIFAERKITLQLPKKQLCAAGNTGQDSCSGDSGGPLVKLIPNSDRFYIEGIVSFGARNCGSENLPGIYTKVYEYLEWILKNVKP